MRGIAEAEKNVLFPSRVRAHACVYNKVWVRTYRGGKEHQRMPVIIVGSAKVLAHSFVRMENCFGINSGT